MQQNIGRELTDAELEQIAAGKVALGRNPDPAWRRSMDGRRPGPAEIALRASKLGPNLSGLTGLFGGF